MKADINKDVTTSPSVSLTVNGTIHHVIHPDPTMRLSTYLRDVLLLKGTKVCCGSGRCGTCTVLWGRQTTTTTTTTTPPRIRHEEHSEEQKLPSRTTTPMKQPHDHPPMKCHARRNSMQPSLVPLNSCLKLLISCHKCIIVTVEGLGGGGGGGGSSSSSSSCQNNPLSNDYIHAIPKALADGNGVQCGFCSPGFTLSAMGYWIQQQQQQQQQQEENSTITNNDDESSSDDHYLRLQLEQYLDGNVCRCTGYRPILESLGELLVDQRNKRQCSHDDSTPRQQNDHHNNHTEEEEEFVPYQKWGFPPTTPDIEDSHDALSCSAKQRGNDCPTDCGGHTHPNRYHHPHHNTCGSSSLHSAGTQLEAYYRPTSLTELQCVYSHLRNQLHVSKSRIQIKAANTASGIRVVPTPTPQQSSSTNANQDGPTVKIDINGMEELQEHRLDSSNGTGGLVIGALTTLSTMSMLLRHYSETSIGTSGSSVQNRQEDPPPWIAAACHLNSIGNTQIRAAGTWAGNLMVSLQHPTTFMSDVVMVLVGLDARVTFLDLTSPTEVKEEVPVSELRRNIRAENRSSTLLVSCFLPYHANLSARPIIMSSPNLSEVIPPTLVSKAFKVSSRPRNSTSHISCFISACMYVHTTLSMNPNFNLKHHDSNNGSLLLSKMVTCTDARVSMAGITPFVLEAKECASAITQCQSLFDDKCLQSCLDALDRDIELSGGVMDAGSTSKSFRLSVARGLIYKFFLSMTKYAAGITTPIEQDELIRDTPVTSKYSYAVYKEKFPVSYPIPNLDSRLLSSGEAKFTLDYEQPQGSLYGALIIATRAGVEFKSIDIQEGLNMDGVVDILTADDIPARNSILKKTPATEEDDECLFLEPGALVPCVGACLGVVVCRTRKQAETTARRIPVYYNSASKNQNGAIFSLEAAMKVNSTFETPHVKPLARGDVTKGLDESPLRLRGRVSTGGQKHFYLENQNAIATPLEGGKLTVRSGTQSVTATQTIVSLILGIPAHKVNVVMKRTGGAFGGKITRSIHCAAAASIAATKLNCSIHVANSRDTDQCMVGGREPLIVDYDVGFDAEGQISAMSLALHMDGGCTKDDSESNLILALRWCDHCYYIPNLKTTGRLYRTNLVSNTACRAPGSVQACHVIDTILNRVANSCGMTLQQCQEINFYQNGQRTLSGDTLYGDTLQRLWGSLLVSSNITERRREIERFNTKSRWRKRGLGLTPCKYGVVGPWFKEIAKVCVFASDGSVEINHSGAEMGQGIDTKVAQIAAMALGIPIDWIVTGEKSSNSQPNTFGTKASGTSEICCAAMLDACSTLNKRLDQYKKAVKEECAGEIVTDSDLFLKAVQAAEKDRVCLSAEGWSAPQIRQGSCTYQYYVYCAAAVEVELDVLTGAIELRRADVTYDCGDQLNASVDIGQIEGGFIMGLGYFLTEKVTGYDDKLFSKNTSEYEPFGSMDIPTTMNISLLENSNNDNNSIAAIDEKGKGAVLRSKATGEPPLICASAAHFATREAIRSARKDMGNEEEYDLEVPATIEARYLACLVDKNQFSLQNGLK